VDVGKRRGVKHVMEIFETAYQAVPHTAQQPQTGHCSYFRD
jgi:hypothetical protein